MSSSRALFGPHAASPVELQQRLEAERRGDPYLLFRDVDGVQRIVPMASGVVRASVGRARSCDLSLFWDHQVSRVHAQLERVGDDWTLIDDGLSRNGTFVNGERLTGRRRLCDGDILRFGTVAVAFCAPAQARGTTARAGDIPRPRLSDAQRRVLVALCRPCRDAAEYATPATNQQIAEELVIGVETVKTHLRALFEAFQVGDLPRHAKRTRLVQLAFESGAVVRRDLARQGTDDRTGHAQPHG